MTRFTAMTLFALCSLGLFAQDRGPGGAGSTGRINFLAGYLSLTEAQKTQAVAVFTAAETASETVRGQVSSARDALGAAIKTNPSDAELDRLSAAVGALEGQLLAIQAKASAKFYALLTAEQKAKYDQAGPRGGSGPRGFGRPAGR